MRLGKCAAVLSMVSSISFSEETSVDSVEVTADVRPEIVVTGTRVIKDLAAAPYALGRLSADALRVGTPVRTVPEALRDEPGVMVQKTGHGQGSPYVRGFTGYRTLLLIDGVRLNNATFRDGPNQYWNTVDALGLSRIELVRGPAAALYGSDAIGGTLNAMTRGAADLRPGSNWDRTLYSRYSSAENSHITRFESIGFVTDSLALTFGLSLKYFGDLEGGESVGTQKKTGYDEYDWDLKLEYFMDNDSWLVFLHQAVVTDDAWRTHKTVYGIDWHGLSVGSELRRSLDQERDLTYLQYHQVNRDGFAEELHAGISYHHQEESRDRLRSGGRWDQQGTDVKTFGGFLTLKSQSPLGELSYGTEWYHDEVGSYNKKLNPDGSVASRSIQGPVADDASYDQAGLFVQDEIALSDHLSLILGVRFDMAAADAGKVEDPLSGDTISVSEDWNDLVGNARIRYMLDEARQWLTFAGVSQGFRAPNLSDLARFDSARTDEIETPAPDLDSETFLSVEAGIKADTPLLTAQLVGYYTVIEDMIVRTPTGRMIDGDYEVTKKNGGDGSVLGVELDGNLKVWRDLSVFGVLSWMDAEVETYPASDAKRVKEPIDRMMPLTGSLGVRWEARGSYWIEAGMRGAAKADSLSTRDTSDTSRIPPGGTPGYLVYDIRGGWHCAGGLVLSLGIENIADEDYRVHGSGVNEPGRNLVLAAEWVF